MPNSFRRSGKVVGFLFSSCCSHDRAICFYQQGSGPFDDIFLAARGRWGVSVENVAWCFSQQHVSGQAAHLAHVVRCHVLHQSSGTAAQMLQRRSRLNGNYHLINMRRAFLNGITPQSPGCHNELVSPQLLAAASPPRRTCLTKESRSGEAATIGVHDDIGSQRHKSQHSCFHGLSNIRALSMDTSFM